MKLTSQDIFFFLKMSIFQFLLKNGFYFYNKDREVIFDLLTNDKKISVQSGIFISNDNSLFITSWMAIKKEFLDAQKLMILTNYINEFSGVFSCYIKDIVEEDFSLFYIKAPIHPEIGTCIDEKFWEAQIYSHVNNISLITDFLFSEFPKSKFYENREVDSQEFKMFFFNQVKSYIEALKVIQEQEIKSYVETLELIKEQESKNKIDYSNWTEKKIEEEIDKELENFLKGEKHIVKLNMLVNALQEKKVS